MQKIPEVSLILPCYNEEKVLDLTIPPLAASFQEAEIDVELILVDNGSTDRTSKVIDRLIQSGLPITKGIVPVNQGQGLGLLTGFSLAQGRYVGFVCADGQVDAEDVVKTYSALRNASTPSISKVRRRFSKDSWIRKVISVCYNSMMVVLFPGIKTLDVNGNPKFMNAETLRKFHLDSRDWFIDAEVMLKTRHLGLNVIEIDVPGQLRKAGRSNVRFSAIIEFLKNILRYRFGRAIAQWKQELAKEAPGAPALLADSRTNQR